MAESLLIPFEGFRRERELVGKILLTYGELEFAMLNIFAAVVENSVTALRTMYQLRSEVNRLAVVEAIASPAFEAVKLGGQFKEGMDAVGCCKNIRNQYAHCTWAPSEGGVLRFANLEEAAKGKGPAAQIVAHPLSHTLLQEQFRYFGYTDHMLLWLNQEYRLKTAQELQGKIIAKPKRLTPPKLHSRGESRWRISLTAGNWPLR